MPACQVARRLPARLLQQCTHWLRSGGANHSVRGLQRLTCWPGRSLSAWRSTQVHFAAAAASTCCRLPIPSLLRRYCQYQTSRKGGAAPDAAALLESIGGGGSDQLQVGAGCGSRSIGNWIGSCRRAFAFGVSGISGCCSLISRLNMRPFGLGHASGGLGRMAGAVSRSKLPTRSKCNCAHRILPPCSPSWPAWQHRPRLRRQRPPPASAGMERAMRCVGRAGRGGGWEGELRVGKGMGGLPSAVFEGPCFPCSPWCWAMNDDKPDGRPRTAAPCV